MTTEEIDHRLRARTALAKDQSLVPVPLAPEDAVTSFDLHGHLHSHAHTHTYTHTNVHNFLIYFKDDF